LLKPDWMIVNCDVSLTSLSKGLIAAFSLLLWSANVSAHLVTTGLGTVYDGISHLVLTPEDLIPALAIALFAGLRGAAPGRSALFVLPLTWFVGGLWGVTIEGLPTLPVAAISFLILGVLVAADLNLSQKSFTAVVIVAGSWVAAMGMLMFGWLFRGQG